MGSNNEKNRGQKSRDTAPLKEQSGKKKLDGWTIEHTHNGQKDLKCKKREGVSLSQIFRPRGVREVRILNFMIEYLLAKSKLNSKIF